MPWQQLVADVSLEIDPATGGLAYSEVGLLVPRQSGKSTLILAKAVHRCSATGFYGRRQQLVYTAQTRKDARKKWDEDYLVQIDESRQFRNKIKPHMQNGNEHLRFGNGSRFGLESTTEKAGHGGTLDECYIDEAFALMDGRMEQALRPAMITRPNKQLWWVSTGGWLDGSPYLWEKVKRGRLSETGKREKRLAYFEWSAPDGADLDDREVWWDCMPALGQTVDEESIADEREAMTEADFRRAFLNQWVPKPLIDPDPVIDPDRWQQLKIHLEPPSGSLAVDVQPDGLSATIAACDQIGERFTVRVLANELGTAWVIPRLLELITERKPAALLVDPSAPAGSLLAGMAAAGIKERADGGLLVKVTARQVAQACGAFKDDTISGRLAHNGQEPLDLALAAARKRPMGEAWAWARKDLDADISPLYAVTLARFGFETYPAESEEVNLW